MNVDLEPNWRNYTMNEMMSDMILKSDIRDDDEKHKAREFLDEAFIKEEITDLFINVVTLPDLEKYPAILSRLPDPYLSIVVTGATAARVNKMKRVLDRTKVPYQTIRVKSTPKTTVFCFLFNTREDKAMGALAIL